MLYTPTLQRMPHMKKSWIDVPWLLLDSLTSKQKFSNTVPLPDLQVIEMLSLQAICFITRNFLQTQLIRATLLSLREDAASRSRKRSPHTNKNTKKQISWNSFIRSVAIHPLAQSTSLTNKFQDSMPSPWWALQTIRYVRAYFPCYPCCWYKKAKWTVGAKNLNDWKKKEGVLLSRETHETMNI